ncbi:MAG: membrane protein insertion efficiency factor YidD [Terriglobales bacterium]
MSPLRKLLRQPATYLALLGVVAASVYADSFRRPDRQLTARVYIALVRDYQRVGSPRLVGYVQCRFRPTCSRYSIETVQRYGLRKGLALTAARLWRCRGSVPLGTNDPVP